MFQGDADASWYFQRIFGDPLTRPERYEADSPHLDVARSAPRCRSSTARRTPACPSARRHALPGTAAPRSPREYLYFPDENHRILRPNHTHLWYETFLNFLDHHVLGAEWQQPGLL
jgi:hypothetical protein